MGYPNPKFCLCAFLGPSSSSLRLDVDGTGTLTLAEFVEGGPA